MRAVLRGGDVKCRYGGDEFLHAPARDAARRRQACRRDAAPRVRGHADRLEETRGVTITTSWSHQLAAEPEMETDAIIGRADAALYRAKDVGRNCVRVADEPTRRHALSSGLGTRDSGSH